MYRLIFDFIIFGSLRISLSHIHKNLYPNCSKVSLRSLSRFQISTILSATSFGRFFHIGSIKYTVNLLFNISHLVIHTVYTLYLFTYKMMEKSMSLVCQDYQVLPVDIHASLSYLFHSLSRTRLRIHKHRIYRIIHPL